MNRFYIFLFSIVFSFSVQSQIATKYTMSFDNAVHHEATVMATFSHLKPDVVEFRMSRSSPGRYALHEFAKNVYNVKVTDSKGHVLKTTRSNPYAWQVEDHDGTIIVSYTLFANLGDGTYSQVDETHAHLNMPATFIYVPELSEKEMEVTFNIRKDLNWKVATQLKHQEGNTYYAKDFQYFMDSPVEIANFRTRSFKVKNQIINVVLHDDAASEDALNTYVENIQKTVLQEEQVFGELPSYDYGEYTFLLCYMPNASGDGMEHRNSTMISSTRSLANGGLDGNIGTVAHEFFHCWNVERIRPKALEPFKFDQVNMSGELWFAEGFTSYFDDLSLCRAGIISQEDYIKGLVGTFNYVWNSPGRRFFNPIEMSYQAPFVDAARSVDPVNRVNTFISYYSYGSAIGLALDLSLREKGLNLDDFMKLMWNNFGKQEKPYTVEDLHNTLIGYAGKDFGNMFFNNYIYKSEMPDMERLLNNVGVSLTQDKSKIAFGAHVENGIISENTMMGSSAYHAGLDVGDKIIKMGDVVLSDSTDFNTVLNVYKPNDTVNMVYERFGNTRETTVNLQASKMYNLSLFEANNIELDTIKKSSREVWLRAKG